MTDQTASGLLSLPAELRNAIWTLLLVHDIDHEASIPINQLPIPYTTHHQRVHTPILRTCQQANQEGTPILYGENVFSAHASLLATLPYFLLRHTPVQIISHTPITAPRVAGLIRRYYLHVRLDTDPRFTRAQVEESFMGVEELEIEVFQSMYASCDFNVLKLFEGVRGVGKAVVRGSVGDGRYADWLAGCMMSGKGAEVEGYSEMYIGGNKGWEAWLARHGMGWGLNG
ncbi:hypothetical protein LTR78_000348 [Recurvomyces mirabilis]|uniref:Uncharacterized protein n=1 Tax=Recurvomyces mirabilis TaxID=574656 RepID=A0AAE1C6H7_9PEZI|nr:hypothetical protein LTR78_000348 [Recurvomyces mirabilis]KAK5162003.1 hypothetical protein LTS14_000349 [Recurvomyces mirabilis]